MNINLIKTCEELKSHVRDLKKSHKTIGVVPTMGALHAGHLSLVEAANAATDETIATIFVNPTQFAEGEDLESYPQSLESDLEKLAQLNVTTVFAPSREEMYPPGYSTSVRPSEVSASLEGEFRPTHFAGVATVVLKLLNLSQADQAFFGQKDFQQLMVIRKMVTDLNVPVKVVGCPIVREPDGLAMSSRNAYLSTEERERALALSKSLDLFKNLVKDGERDGHVLMAEMRQMLIDEGVSSIDYAVVADPLTLQAYDQIEFPVIGLVAAYVGKTRLIDNWFVESV